MQLTFAQLQGPGIFRVRANAAEVGSQSWSANKDPAPPSLLPASTALPVVAVGVALDEGAQGIEFALVVHGSTIGGKYEIYVEDDEDTTKSMPIIVVGGQPATLQLTDWTLPGIAAKTVHWRWYGRTVGKNSGFKQFAMTTARVFFTARKPGAPWAAGATVESIQAPWAEFLELAMHVKPAGITDQAVGTAVMSYLRPSVMAAVFGWKFRYASTYLADPNWLASLDGYYVQYPPSLAAMALDQKPTMDVAALIDRWQHGAAATASPWLTTGDCAAICATVANSLGGRFQLGALVGWPPGLKALNPNTNLDPYTAFPGFPINPVIPYGGTGWWVGGNAKPMNQYDPILQPQPLPLATNGSWPIWVNSHIVATDESGQHVWDLAYATNVIESAEVPGTPSLKVTLAQIPVGVPFEVVPLPPGFNYVQQLVNLAEVANAKNKLQPVSWLPLAALTVGTPK